jgi:hypothetical protein
MNYHQSSFTKEPTYNNDNYIVYPVPIDLPKQNLLGNNIYDMLHSVLNNSPIVSPPLDENIYDNDILHPVSNDLQTLVRSLSDDEVFNKPEQQPGLWCKPSPRDDDDDDMNVVLLSEEMTYTRIDEPII